MRTESAKATRVYCGVAALAACMAVFTPSAHAGTPFAVVQSPATQSSATTARSPGALLPADQLAALLPATVYFQGRSAPIQLRNSAGTTFGENALLWAALVDTSGYSTSVQERYQFYFVTESALRFGDVRLPAGAYGGGFLGDRFVLMDLGGHTIGEGPTQTDAALRRPRPLQMIADQPSSVRLYLGRRWVLLRSDTSANQR